MKIIKEQLCVAHYNIEQNLESGYYDNYTKKQKVSILKTSKKILDDLEDRIDYFIDCPWRYR